jgi:hypothetical protein
VAGGIALKIRAGDMTRQQELLETLESQGVSETDVRWLDEPKLRLRWALLAKPDYRLRCGDVMNYGILNITVFLLM